VTYKYGLKPVTRQPTIRLASYYTSDLPTVESLKFPLGHADKIQPEMLMNNILGCCAYSGSIEEVRLVNALRGVTVPFTDKTVVENYEATGYKPGPEIEGFNPDGSAIIDPYAPQNPTDGGTDVHELYDLRKSTGIVDADGKYHKIVAYAGLTPGDPDELLVALSLFDVVGVGFQVPEYAQDQFAAGEPWHLLRGRHNIVGGHYVPIVGATDRHTLQPFTWGALAGMEDTFYSALATVAVVALTEELFNGDKDIDGLDQEKLAADLPELNTGPVMAKAPRRRKDDAA
jgi:hypothetical protein